jgi:hypothetical protein
MAGINVARDPSKYARLHFKTPLPKSDAKKLYMRAQIADALLQYPTRARRGRGVTP